MHSLGFFRLFICSLVCAFSVSISSSGFRAQAREVDRYEVACDSALWFRSLEIADSQVGTVETGNNRGAVEKYQRAGGYGPGTPYCYLGHLWSFQQAADTLRLPRSAIPILRTGLASAGHNDMKRKGVRARADPRRGDFSFWRLPKSASGHVERVDSVLRKGFTRNIAFNTSKPGVRGSQRDGGGVWRPVRCYLHPLGRMNFVGFVGRKDFT